MQKNEWAKSKKTYLINFDVCIEDRLICVDKIKRGLLQLHAAPIYMVMITLKYSKYFFEHALTQDKAQALIIC